MANLVPVAGEATVPTQSVGDVSSMPERARSLAVPKEGEALHADPAGAVLMVTLVARSCEWTFTEMLVEVLFAPTKEFAAVVERGGIGSMVMAASAAPFSQKVTTLPQAPQFLLSC